MLVSKTYIYTLSCPITGMVRYVGKSVNPKKRLQRHLKDSEKPTTHKECWIKSVINKGSNPILDIVDCIDSKDDNFWEEYYISLFKSWGFDLTNKTLGGDGMKNITQDIKDKISAKLKGKKQSEETKRKRSETLKMVWQNEDLRELKRKQTTELNRLGVLNRNFKSRKGIPFKGDRDKLSKSSKIRWEDSNKRLEEAINKGSKPFAAYNVSEVKRGNRWGKGCVIVGDVLAKYDGNYTQASRDFNIERAHIRRCLNGKLLTVKNITFKFL